MPEDPLPIPTPADLLTRAATSNETLCATMRALGLTPVEVTARGESETDEEIHRRVQDAFDQNLQALNAHLNP